MKKKLLIVIGIVNDTNGKLQKCDKKTVILFQGEKLVEAGWNGEYIISLNPWKKITFKEKLLEEITLTMTDGSLYHSTKLNQNDICKFKLPGFSRAFY